VSDGTSMARPRTELGWALALWLMAALAAGFVLHGRSSPPPRFVSSLRVGPGAGHASKPQRGEVDVVARRFRGDRRQTGRSPHLGPTRGRLRYRFMTLGPITAQPVLGRDGQLHFGSHDGFLYTLDATGRLAWRRALGAPVHTTALVASDALVVVGADDGRLELLEPSGALRLGLELGASIGAAPVETTDGLYVVAVGPRLIALDSGGVQRWAFRAGSEIHATAAVDDDNRLYVGAQDRRLHALGRGGKLRWTFDADADLDGSPLVADDGSVVFGSDAGRLYVLNDRGELRWERQLEAPLRAPVALGADDTLVVVSHGLRPSVQAFGLADGALRWRHALPQGESPWTDARSGPLVDKEGNVYVGASDGKLYALDAHGKLRFSYATGGRIDSSPVLGPDGTLYFGSRDGWLYALR